MVAPKKKAKSPYGHLIINCIHTVGVLHDGDHPEVWLFGINSSSQ
jgi:hypothetical protein